MMSSKKLEGLTAQQRLTACRAGDSEVFDAEMARAEAVMRERLTQGLDIGEQIAWVDRIGYEYNVFLASQFGITSDQVAKHGYGSELAAVIGGGSPYGDTAGGDKTNAQALSRQQTSVQTAGDSAEQALVKLRLKNAREDARAAEESLEQKYEGLKNALYSDTLNTLPQERERIANLGASWQGGTVKTAELQTAASLRQAMASLDAAMLGEVAQARKEIARLEQEGKLELAKLEEEKAEKELKRLAKEKAALDAQLRDEQAMAFEREKWEAEQKSKADSAAQAQENWEREQALAEQKERNSYEKWLAETATEKEQSDRDEAYRLRALTLSEQRLAFDKWKAEQNSETAAGQGADGKPVTDGSGRQLTDEESAYYLFLSDTIRALRSETVLDPVTHQPVAAYMEAAIARFIMGLERFPLALRRQALMDADFDIDRLLSGYVSTDFADGMNSRFPDFGQQMMEYYYESGGQ